LACLLTAGLLTAGLLLLLLSGCWPAAAAAVRLLSFEPLKPELSVPIGTRSSHLV
jgi:hypothetical protein